jgi:hypothetical protein
MSFWDTVRLWQIKEVWANWLGWYWYITEHHEGTLAFGLMRKNHLEWGFVDLAWLRRLEEHRQAWRIPRENWALCPDVVAWVQKRRKRNGAGKDGDTVMAGRERISERGWKADGG